MRMLAGACLALALLGLPVSASASLGDDEGSVRADQAGLHGTLRIRHAAAFDVHEIATASGTVVREYVSAGGRVFGIAWHGPRLPDLRRLLGSHFERYRGMPRDRRAGRSLKRVALADLVVESSGHLRSFSGKAWLPGPMPRGVGPEDIR
jgi:hypothetical protein